MLCCNRTTKEDWKWGKMIGSGSFANVWECWRLKDNKRMACKVIPLEALNEFTLKCVHDEVKIMKKLSGCHPVLLEVFEVQKLSDRFRIFVEICDGEDLYLHMMKRDIHNEEQIKTICGQLVECLAFLHSYKISHLDVKPSNIAFKDKDTLSIKLLDFGFAQKRKLKRGQNCIGTLRYMAPEVSLKVGFTEAADMWSLGVMMYEMIMKRKPFSNFENHDEALCKTALDKLFECEDEKQAKVSSDAQDCIKKLLLWNAADRLTALEVMRHQFFANEQGRKMNKGTLRKFKQFARRGPLQKALFPVMMEHCEERKNFFHEQFETMYDADSIDHASIYDFLQKDKDSTEEEKQEIIDSLNIKHTGKIHKDDFKEWFEYDFIMSQDERLWQFIEKLDTQGNGKIKKHDMEEVIRKHHGKSAEEYMEIVNNIFEAAEEYEYEVFAEIVREDKNLKIFDLIEITSKAT